MPTKTKDSWSLWKAIDGTFHTSLHTRVFDSTTQSWKDVVLEGATEVPASECSFVAAMKLTEFYHGRSCHFWFKDIQTNRRYLVQGTEMKTILMKHSLDQGLICGRWGWVKRGGTISIKLLEELDDVELTGVCDA